MGQRQDDGSSLLLDVVHLPGLIRFHLGQLGQGRRSSEPVDAAWVESLLERDDLDGTGAPPSQG